MRRSFSLSGPDTQYNYTDHATVFTGRISGDGELFLSFESNQDGVKVFNIEVAEDGTFVAPGDALGRRPRHHGRRRE